MTPAEPHALVPAAAAVAPSFIRPHRRVTVRHAGGAYHRPGRVGGLAAGLSGLSPFEGCRARGASGPFRPPRPRGRWPVRPLAPPPASPPRPWPPGLGGGCDYPRAGRPALRHPLTSGGLPAGPGAATPARCLRDGVGCRAAEQTRPADAVYSFSTSFTPGPAGSSRASTTPTADNPRLGRSPRRNKINERALRDSVTDFQRCGATLRAGIRRPAGHFQGGLRWCVTSPTPHRRRPHGEP